MLDELNRDLGEVEFLIACQENVIFEAQKKLQKLMRHKAAMESLIEKEKECSGK